jgi:hypothetical protein
MRKKAEQLHTVATIAGSKWIGMVYHCAPFGHRISLSTRKCEDASIVLRFTAFCKFLLTWTAKYVKHHVMNSRAGQIDPVVGEAGALTTYLQGQLM